MKGETSNYVHITDKTLSSNSNELKFAKFEFETFTKRIKVKNSRITKQKGGI